MYTILLNKRICKLGTNMSMWCPKCQNITYNKKKCDKCNHVIEDTSKSYDIPKPHKARILKPKSIQKKETLSYLSFLDELIDKVVEKLFIANNGTVKKNMQDSTKITYHDKKIRGDEYEKYIANHYRQLGCDVIEHGKEKGVKDGGIDLIARLGNEVILIQCKDWNENYSHKIDHKDIKVLRTDANDFLENNPIYKNCEIKLRYTLSGNFLHKSAEKYIEECKENISYEIIKPIYRKSEEIRPNYINKQSRKKKKTHGTYTEKIILGVISILLILFLFKPKYETEETNHSNTNKNMITLTDANQEKQFNSQIEYDRKLKISQEEQRRGIEKYNEENKKYIKYQNVSKVQIQKSEREKAKEMLLKQMKN